MNMEEAYWISPAGIVHEVPDKHITMIFDDPELFNLTLEYIHAVYDKHNEPYRVEGKARRDILLRLFDEGWIRVRKYMRPYRWSLNVKNKTKESSERIRKFVLLMIEKGHSEYDEVLVDMADSKNIYTFKELLNRGKNEI